MTRCRRGHSWALWSCRWSTTQPTYPIRSRNHQGTASGHLILPLECIGLNIDILVLSCLEIHHFGHITSKFNDFGVICPTWCNSNDLLTLFDKITFYSRSSGVPLHKCGGVDVDVAQMHKRIMVGHSWVVIGTRVALAFHFAIWQATLSH